MAFRGETYYQESTLFRDDDMGGQIQVIAIPYIPGNHVCKSPKQALLLVAFMKLLHESGNVHGDIRAFNIVFGEDKNSDAAALIDFDFGGRENTVKYPPGYVSALDDGVRIGKPCVEISKEHDIYALAHVLGKLHDVSEEESVLNMWHLGKSKTLEELERYSRNLLTQGAVFLPDRIFQKFLDDQVHTDRNEGQTETGAAVTPSKEIKSGPKGVKRDRGETTSEAGS